MKCGFCGYDNPDGAKRCKHCKASLTTQQMYARGSNSGFTGSVNRGGSGVTRQSTSTSGQSTGSARQNTRGTWQNTGSTRQSAGSTWQNTSGTRQSARSQEAYQNGTAANPTAAFRSAASSVKAAKVFALAFVLVPAIFMIVVVAMILRTNREWQQEAEIQVEGIKDLQDDFWENHGINKISYSLEKNSDVHYTMTLNGVEYIMFNYKNALTGKNSWRSDYFTGTFKRMTASYIGTPIYQSSFGDVVADLQYSVSGLFPLWLNFSEIERIENGTADRNKWLSAWSEGQSWHILISIILDDNYDVTKEWFDEIKDDLFFATIIDIECPGGTYRYYLYEDRFEEE